MTHKTAQFLQFRCHIPRSSECGSSRETQKPEASTRLTILDEKVENL